MPSDMTWLWATIQLAGPLGCSASEGPPRDRTPEFSDAGLAVSGASGVHALWRTPGTYDLPQSTLPAGYTLQTRFPVPVKPGKTRRKATGVWTGVAPVIEQAPGRVGPPDGMRVFVDGEQITFSPQLQGRSWRFSNSKLTVSWPSETPPEVTLEYDTAKVLLERRDFSTAELPAAEFADYEVTINQITRPGLLLPAPTTATWDVTLPPGARFKAYPAIAPLPIRSLTSDGAYISLTVAAGGEETQVGRTFVRANESFQRWSLDLSPWGGQAVTLKLATEPHRSADFDHVFVGTPTVWGAADRELRRVVVIGLDTTRPDHLGFFGYDRPTTPELDAVLSSATVFDQAWTPAPRTRPSFRSATTGRNPLDAVGAMNIGEVFSLNGFATAGLVANVHLQPRFDFHRGFDSWTLDGQATANSQVNRALHFLEENADRDSYLFLHVMDPHLLYKAPAQFEHELVQEPDLGLPPAFNRWDVYRWQTEGTLDAKRKNYIRDLYDAELRYMSAELGRLFAALDRMPGRSLVVLHNDHGEEFWEHGGYEHNHTLYDEVTRGLLMFRSGAGQAAGRRISTPATLADIGPTLYELLGLSNPPPTDGHSLAPLLRGADPDAGAASRPLGVGHLRYGTERWGVVVDQHKYVLHTGSGREELYDLAADAGETKDLSPGVPLTRFRAALSEAHSDMPVGPGWRINVQLRTSERRPFEIELPAAALRAEVIDPEAMNDRPANQAWGEPPRHTRGEIGAVSLSEDKTVLTYTPGSRPAKGALAVQFAEPVAPTGLIVTRSGESLAVTESSGIAMWRSGADQLVFVPGTVVFPPPNEAARIAALRGGTEPAGDDRAMLCALGYLSGAACEGDAGE